jgi:hypothetical protein
MPYGLFSTFTTRGAASDRWEAGVAWESIPCEDLGVLPALECLPGHAAPAPGPSPTKDLGATSMGFGEASPFTVYGHFTCSPVGYAVDDAQRLAEAALYAREEASAEHTFWTGDQGNYPSLASQADTVLAGGTAVSPVSGLSMLEDWLAGAYGSVGVIHMTRGTGIRLMAAHVLPWPSGTRLNTGLGTPVAAGAGYPGSGPTGQAAGNNKVWMYASPAVFGYRSEVFGAAGGTAILDRSNNNLTAIAERNYLLGFDPCGVAAVQVDTALS